MYPESNRYCLNFLQLDNVNITVRYAIRIGPLARLHSQIQWYLVPFALDCSSIDVCVTLINGRQVKLSCYNNKTTGFKTTRATCQTILFIQVLNGVVGLFVSRKKKLERCQVSTRLTVDNGSLIEQHHTLITVTCFESN